MKKLNQQINMGIVDSISSQHLYEISGILNNSCYAGNDRNYYADCYSVMIDLAYNEYLRKLVV